MTFKVRMLNPPPPHRRPPSNRTAVSSHGDDLFGARRRAWGVTSPTAAAPPRPTDADSSQHSLFSQDLLLGIPRPPLQTPRIPGPDLAPPSACPPHVAVEETPMSEACTPVVIRVPREPHSMSLGSYGALPRLFCGALWDVGALWRPGGTSL